MLVILSGYVGRRIHLSKMTPRKLFSLKITDSSPHDYKISTSPSPTLPQQHVLEILTKTLKLCNLRSVPEGYRLVKQLKKKTLILAHAFGDWRSNCLDEPSFHQ